MPGLAPYANAERQLPDGRTVPAVVINPVKNYVRSYHIVGSEPEHMGPGVNIDEVRFLIDSNGHFEWGWLVGTAQSPVFMEFFDIGMQRRLQNKPVHSGTILGSARRPFRLPEPYLFNVGDNERRMICTVRNVVTDAPNEVRLTLYGRRYYHREAPPDVAMEMRRKFGEDWRCNDCFITPNETAGDGTVTPVAGGGTATFTFESDADADTDLHKLMVVSTGAFEFQLREDVTDRRLMNEAISSINGWGSAQFPFYFADTYLLERSKRLIMDVTDLSGTSNSIYATIAGRKLIC